MKKHLFFILALVFALFTSAQDKVNLSKSLRNIGVNKQSIYFDSDNQKNDLKVPMKSTSMDEEEVIGKSVFDLQSNSGMQNRIFLYEDGTVGATFTYGYNDPGFDDRGTGYNYFDGNAWGPYPSVRIESDRTGWPAYAAFGENGEIVVSHLAGATDEGLLFNKRSEKGTGTWEESLFQGPAGYEALAWPRMITSGIDNSVLHLVALTLPEVNGGSIYQGQDGAILYSRSTDGGVFWEPENFLFEELDADNYVAFDGDTYEIQAQGDNVAILIGEPWIDMILMKSTDGGDSWSKTIIWENPYPMWTSGTVTDTFYCVDGAHSLDFDANGLVHIAFGINRALSADGTSQSWFPFVGGVGYWNESIPVFSNNTNALNPYGHPDSELIENYTLIGWTQDMDGDSLITFVGNSIDNIGTYQLGLSSMPQIHIDEMGFIYVLWSSVTETYDNGIKNYRHLWARVSIDGGNDWAGFYHATSSLIHIFDECVWPVFSISSDFDYLYLLYQTDGEPGLYVRFNEHTPVENSMQFLTIPKEWVGLNENNKPDKTMVVSQNFPNPCSGITTVFAEIERNADLLIEIHNMIGQKVYTIDAGTAHAGVNKIEISAEGLAPGVYFYTVKAGENEITKKMIIE